MKQQRKNEKQSRKADKSSEITLYIKIMDCDRYTYLHFVECAFFYLWYSDRIHLIIWHCAPFAEPEHLISEVCWKLYVLSHKYRRLIRLNAPFNFLPFPLCIFIVTKMSGCTTKKGATSFFNRCCNHPDPWTVPHSNYKSIIKMDISIKEQWR